MKTIKELKKIAYCKGYDKGVRKQLKETDMAWLITPTKKVQLIRKDERTKTLKKVLGLIDDKIKLKESRIKELSAKWKVPRDDKSMTSRNMEYFETKAQIEELEELKARINGT